MLSTKTCSIMASTRFCRCAAPAVVASLEFFKGDCDDAKNWVRKDAHCSRLLFATEAAANRRRPEPAFRPHHVNILCLARRAIRLPGPHAGRASLYSSFPVGTDRELIARSAKGIEEGLRSLSGSLPFLIGCIATVGASFARSSTNFPASQRSVHQRRQRPSTRPILFSLLRCSPRLQSDLKASPHFPVLPDSYRS